MLRRTYLKLIGAAATAGAFTPATIFAGGRHDFVPAQLLPRGQSRAPYPSTLRSMMVQLMKRTSIDADTDRVDLRLDSEKLFHYPFLYLAGREEYEEFTAKEIKRLRALLDAGGTILVDDATGIEASAFDAWFRRQVGKLYPRQKIKRLPADHTLFRSFYFIDRIGGRVLIKDGVEGITIGDRSPLIYCQNDLGGAWATDLFGKPLVKCVPGGEGQREKSWRLGVNVIMYMLCMNYKKDRVHVEAILQRRKLR